MEGGNRFNRKFSLDSKKMLSWIFKSTSADNATAATTAKHGSLKGYKSSDTSSTAAQPETCILKKLYLSFKIEHAQTHLMLKTLKLGFIMFL